MLSVKQAERIYERICENVDSKFDSKELEVLTAAMSSLVIIKALGQVLGHAEFVRKQMSALDMGRPESAHEFSRGQGQIQGVNQVIAGILSLVTEKEDEEEQDNDSTD